MHTASTQNASIWSLTAAAPSDSVFRALCTNLLAHLLTYLLIRAFDCYQRITLNGIMLADARYLYGAELLVSGVVVQLYDYRVSVK